MYVYNYLNNNGAIYRGFANIFPNLGGGQGATTSTIRANSATGGIVYVWFFFSPKNFTTSITGTPV
jgi:hypothetical protein